MITQLTRKLPPICGSYGLSKCIIMKNFPVKRMSSSAESASVYSNRLYTADGYYWIRMLKADVDKRRHFEIGMTKYLIDTEIRGIVDSISLPDISRNGIENGNSNGDEKSSSLTIHWSGLEVGTGDELYHSVWKNIDGIFLVEPFLPLKLIDLNVYEYNLQNIKKADSLEDDWLVKISCDQKDLGVLSESFQTLRTQADHDEFIKLSLLLKEVTDETESYNK